MVDGEINGKPVKILFNTGTTFSMIPRHEADRLGLILQPLYGTHAYGPRGVSTVYEVQVEKLRIGDFTKTKAQLRVAGDQDATTDYSVVLGDDFFSQVDTELDLPENVVRLFKAEGCAPPLLVYWGASYSQAELLSWDRDQPVAQVIAEVDGKQVLARVDSGADQTYLDVSVADALGVKHPVLDAAQSGEAAVRFESFALGDERIGNPRLVVADLLGGMRYQRTGTNLPRLIRDAPSMLIGDDFLHSHRVFLDVRDRLILFSYQGGPVFQPPPAPSKPSP